MQIKPYHLNPCMPLSSAKLHSYAPRLSITVSVVQLFTSQHFLLQRQAHVHLIGSHSVSRLCRRSLWMSQLEEMEACISAWNNAPAPKWQALDIVGKWMLNSFYNHQQQPRVWKINFTPAKGKGNYFARYATKSCLWAIHLSNVFAKKKSLSFLF